MKYIHCVRQFIYKKAILLKSGPKQNEYMLLQKRQGKLIQSSTSHVTTLSMAD